MTTSQLDGIGPASLKTLTKAVLDSNVPLHFQFPPIKYLRGPSVTGIEDPLGRDDCDLLLLLLLLYMKKAADAPTAAAVAAIMRFSLAENCNVQ